MLFNRYSKCFLPFKPEHGAPRTSCDTIDRSLGSSPSWLLPIHSRTSCNRRSPSAIACFWFPPEPPTVTRCLPNRTITMQNAVATTAQKPLQRLINAKRRSKQMNDSRIGCHVLFHCCQQIFPQRLDISLSLRSV